MLAGLVVSLIFNLIFFAIILWFSFEIPMYKIKVKYQSDIAKLYKDRVDSLNESYDEMSRIATDAINSNKHIIDVANHTQYKLEHCMKAIRYAEHFLKPRKAAEMYHILGQFLRFEEWKALQEENKE